MTNVTENKKNIFQRMLEVMSSVDYLQKHDTNGGLRYKFVSHDAVVGELHAPMTQAGIILVPSVESFAHNGIFMVMKLRCDFINADNPTDMITVRHEIPSKTPSDEKTYGSTLSYGIKYVLLKTFMLETGDDCDIDEKDKEANKAKSIDARNSKTLSSAPVTKNFTTTAVKPMTQANLDKITPSATKSPDLYLGPKISLLLPKDVPMNFCREFVENIMYKKSISWEAAQEEILKTTSRPETKDWFITTLKKDYATAQEIKALSNLHSKTA